jgi:hypothetical protein
MDILDRLRTESYTNTAPVLTAAHDEIVRLTAMVDVLKRLLSESLAIFSVMEKAIKGEISNEAGLTAIEDWIIDVQPDVEHWVELKAQTVA